MSYIRYDVNPHSPYLFGFEHIEIEHDGSLTWDECQDIKNQIWGNNAIAVDLFPPERNVVNGRSRAPDLQIRHLWRMPDDWKWPDISGGLDR